LGVEAMKRPKRIESWAVVLADNGLRWTTCRSRLEALREKLRLHPRACRIVRLVELTTAEKRVLQKARACARPGYVPDYQGLMMLIEKLNDPA
jgi:IS5 family transposase